MRILQDMFCLITFMKECLHASDLWVIIVTLGETFKLKTSFLCMALRCPHVGMTGQLFEGCPAGHVP